MVLLVMSNVALVVIAANYSQQSHPCKSLTLHSSKGTTDTQLTTSESLSTRTWIPPLVSSTNSRAMPTNFQCWHSCNSISQAVEVFLNSTRVIRILGMLINAVLTSPSMLIGREVSVTQRPMAVVRPLDGGCGRSIFIIVLPMDQRWHHDAFAAT